MIVDISTFEKDITKEEYFIPADQRDYQRHIYETVTTAVKRYMDGETQQHPEVSRHICNLHSKIQNLPKTYKEASTKQVHDMLEIWNNDVMAFNDGEYIKEFGDTYAFTKRWHLYHIEFCSMEDGHYKPWQIGGDPGDIIKSYLNTGKPIILSNLV